jgi:hypothetical protein
MKTGRKMTSGKLVFEFPILEAQIIRSHFNKLGQTEAWRVHYKSSA